MVRPVAVSKRGCQDEDAVAECFGIQPAMREERAAPHHCARLSCKPYHVPEPRASTLRRRERKREREVIQRTRARTPHTFVPAHLHICLPTCTPACLPTYICAYVHPCPHALRTHWPFSRHATRAVFILMHTSTCRTYRIEHHLCISACAFEHLHMPTSRYACMCGRMYLRAYIQRYVCVGTYL